MQLSLSCFLADDKIIDISQRNKLIHISQMNKLILPNMENKRELGRHLPPLCWLVATSQSGVLQ
jgi:hypothetical protein